jgi:hypothetical protein
LERETFSKARAFAVAILVLLATVAAAGAALAVWLDRQLLDTNEWTKTSSRLLADQNIRNAVSLELVTRLRREARLDRELESRLPPRARILGSVGLAALQNVSATNLSDFLGSKRAQVLWRQANRQTHRALVAVLEGKNEWPVSASHGTVVLDLGPMLVAVAERLGVKKSLAVRMNPGGKVVLARSGELATAQDAVHAIRFLSLWLSVLALALFLLAVFLARGRRARTIEACGACLLLVGAVLVIVRIVVSDAVVGAYVQSDTYRPAIRSAWMIETRLLLTIAIVLIVGGAVAFLGGLVAERRRRSAARA